MERSITFCSLIPVEIAFCSPSCDVIAPPAAVAVASGLATFSSFTVASVFGFAPPEFAFLVLWVLLLELVAEVVVEFVAVLVPAGSPIRHRKWGRVAVCRHPGNVNLKNTQKFC